MYAKSIAGQVAGPTDLELVNYGAGYTWFWAELDAVIRDADRLDQDLTRLLDRRPEPQSEPEDRRYVLTDAGRRALAMEALFGPWPNVARSSPTRPRQHDHR